jgi:CBS domain-containing protein
VVREGKVVGIVTRRDVIRTLAAMNGTQKEEKQNQK